MPANYSVNFSAVLNAASGTITKGTAVILTTDRLTYLPATTANMTSAGVTVVSGIAIQDGSSVQAIPIQSDGIIYNETTGLGPGIACFVRANTSTGRVERVPSPAPSDRLVGYTNEVGDLTVILSASGIIGSVGPGQGVTTTLDASAPAIGIGTPLCLKTGTTWTKATRANLLAVGNVVGRIATQASGAGSGAAITAAVPGNIVDTSVFGAALAGSGVSDVGVNDSGACLRIVSSGAEANLGQADASGNLTFVPFGAANTTTRNVVDPTAPPWNCVQGGALTDQSICTANTTGLNAATAYAFATGRELKIPNGTICINGTWNPFQKSGGKITGDGTGMSVIEWRGGIVGPIMHLEHCEKTHLHGFTLGSRTPVDVGLQMTTRFGVPAPLSNSNVVDCVVVSGAYDQIETPYLIGGIAHKAYDGAISAGTNGLLILNDQTTFQPYRDRGKSVTIQKAGNVGGTVPLTANIVAVIYSGSVDTLVLLDRVALSDVEGPDSTGSTTFGTCLDGNNDFHHLSNTFATNYGADGYKFAQSQVYGVTLSNPKSYPSTPIRWPCTIAAGDDTLTIIGDNAQKSATGAITDGIKTLTDASVTFNPDWNLVTIKIVGAVLGGGDLYTKATYSSAHVLTLLDAPNVTATGVTYTVYGWFASWKDKGKICLVRGVNGISVTSTTGAVTNGSLTLTDPTAPFNPAQVNATILVTGAGAGGTNLVTAFSYVSATTIAMVDASHITGSGVTYKILNDSRATIVDVTHTGTTTFVRLDTTCAVSITNQPILQFGAQWAFNCEAGGFQSRGGSTASSQAGVLRVTGSSSSPVTLSEFIDEGANCLIFAPSSQNYKKITVEKFRWAGTEATIVFPVIEFGLFGPLLVECGSIGDPTGLGAPIWMDIGSNQSPNAQNYLVTFRNVTFGTGFTPNSAFPFLSSGSISPKFDNCMIIGPGLNVIRLGRYISQNISVSGALPMTWTVGGQTGVNFGWSPSQGFNVAVTGAGYLVVPFINGWQGFGEPHDFGAYISGNAPSAFVFTGTFPKGGLCVTTASNVTITDASANFQPGDVGKTIEIVGAGIGVLGAGGSKLHRTTIAVRNSATSIDLASAPRATLAAAHYGYGASTGQMVKWGDSYNAIPIPKINSWNWYEFKFDGVNWHYSGKSIMGLE